jgi:hypothetical protein
MSAAFITSDGRYLVFDATIGETFSTPISVTRHPIETGADVTDHAQPQPVSVLVEGVVSETPFEIPTGRLALSLTAPLSGPQRTQAAADFLRSIEGQRISYYSTRRGSYLNCVVTRWTETTDGFARGRFQVELRQIRVAGVGTVTIPPEAPANDAVADEQDVGVQPTSAPDETSEAADKSALATILDALGV